MYAMNGSTAGYTDTNDECFYQNTKKCSTTTTTKNRIKKNPNRKITRWNTAEKYNRNGSELASYNSTASTESNIGRALYGWLYEEKLSAAGYINICCDNANPQYWKRSEIATGTYALHTRLLQFDSIHFIKYALMLYSFFSFVLFFLFFFLILYLVAL